MLLIWTSVAWLAGIWAGPVLRLDPAGTAFITLSSLLLALLWRKTAMVLLAGFCLAALLLGSARYQQEIESAASSPLLAYHGEEVELEGWIAADPELREKTAQLRVETTALYRRGQRQEVAGTILVTGPQFPQRHYGDVLRLSGKLDAPQTFGDFDYPGYLARHGVYSTMLFPRMQARPGEAGVPALSWLFAARGWLASNLARVLPEPQAALAQGMLLGMRSPIPDDLMDAFSRTGTAHIVVISGQNLTLLAGYILRAGVPLVGRRPALWLSLVVITLYTFLVGGQPPVVRADVMSAIFILGTYLGRQREGSIALAISAAAMVAFQPLLLWDVSFQLSFAATAGLLFITPPIEGFIRRRAPGYSPRDIVSSRGLPAYLIEGLAVTAAATAAVLPLLLANFQRLSLITLPANLMLLPALPGIMLFGALASVMGSIPLVGTVAGWMAWPFLTYLTSGATLLASLPLSSIEVSGFGAGPVVVYYSLLCMALLWAPRVEGDRA